MSPTEVDIPAPKPRRIGLGTLRRWHWISSAVALAAMLLFSITGITLNHATDIEARPTVSTWQDSLPPPLLESLSPAALDAKAPSPAETTAPLPESLRLWLRQQHQLAIGAEQLAEWRADEIYLPMPRPGGDAWLRVDRASGEIEFENSDRGWIAWANDLHKGRHTGLVWVWFIDVFAVACLVFCLTGLLILQRHAAQRPATWPITALGLLLPALVLLLAVH